MIRHTLAALLIAAPGVLILGTATEVAPNMSACQYEDSAGPCVWDARHMGNGSGKSFIRKASGRVEYVGHRRAHRLSH